MKVNKRKFASLENKYGPFFFLSYKKKALPVQAFVHFGSETDVSLDKMHANYHKRTNVESWSCFQSSEGFLQLSRLTNPSRPKIFHVIFK